jgi:hypothetical protein
MNVLRDDLHRQAGYPHSGVKERQTECRSDGLEGMADKYRGVEGEEAGVGDEGEGVGEIEEKGSILMDPHHMEH